MPWGRIDDKLHSHRKVRKTGKRGVDRLAAMGLWALALSYTCDHKTDGLIDRETVEEIAGTEQLAERLAAALVASGLWFVTDDGWRFHDWAEYNREREVLEAEQARKREAGKLGAAKRWSSTKSSTSDGSPHSTTMAGANGTAMALDASDPDPDPDPDPLPKKNTEVPVGKPPGSDVARTVFRYYADQRAFYLGARSTSQPTAKRLKMIRERLKEGFTVEDLKRAVDGMFLTPFNMGENNRNTKYIEPEHVFREAAQVERHRATADERAPVPRLDVAVSEEGVPSISPERAKALQAELAERMKAVSRDKAPFLYDEPPKEATS